MDEVEFPPGFDRRVAHGHATKQEILIAAVKLGSLEGLRALTIGRMSRETGLSKAGVFAHFGSKLQMLLDTIDVAYGMFATEVMSQSVEASAGKERVLKFVSLFADFEANEELPGSFFTRVIVEQAHLPGEVRKRLVEIFLYWHQALIHQLNVAKEQKQLPAKLDVERVAFEILAALRYAGLHYELTGDARCFEYARQRARDFFD